MNLSSGAPGSLTLARPLICQPAEHRTQVPVALHHHDRGDHGERNGGNHQPDGPEVLPEVHQLSPSMRDQVAPPRDAGLRLPNREPRTSPKAARPNAQKPVMFSLQCRKKNGMTAPAAPISIAR